MDAGLTGWMHEGQVEVDPDALAAAIAEQAPQFARLPLRRLRSAGTVVAPFRLGDHHVARLPLVPVSDAAARNRLATEAAHGRFLQGRLPVAVPQPVLLGEPFDGYPGVWSIWTWLDGASLDQSPAPTSIELADDLAATLTTFRRLPCSGEWNGVGRGAHPLADTDWVRTSIAASAHLIDAEAATAVWDDALAARPIEGAARYIHGDPVPGNLLVSNGRLSGLIDIAEPSRGDPASDLAPAWTVFDEPARTRFRDAMGLDEAAWQRGRGWALEMAIGGLHYYEHSNPSFFQMARRTLDRLLSSRV